MDTSKEAITVWCREYIAGLLEVPADSIDPEATFDRLGVDSSVAVSLLIEVEERYGIDLPGETLFKNPAISQVAAYLAGQFQRDAACQ